jgi:hypothetical protein
MSLCTGRLRQVCLLRWLQRGTVLEVSLCSVSDPTSEVSGRSHSLSI